MWEVGEVCRRFADNPCNVSPEELRVVHEKFIDETCDLCRGFNQELTQLGLVSIAADVATALCGGNSYNDRLMKYILQQSKYCTLPKLEE